MSGHSKWSTIKHKKALKDQKRGAIFSRLSKDISMAVKEGGSDDPQKNHRLRTVLQKAKNSNMPLDNITRAIKKASGRSEETNIDEIVYEGYTSDGIAVIVRVKTDNRQRTTPEIKNIFDKAEARMGEPGSAIFMFEIENSKFEPKMKIPLQDKEKIERLKKFVDELEQHDDVEEVITNSDDQ